MQTIIDPIDKQQIKSELTPDKFLRPTNKAGNEVYIITHHDSPNTMLEIGRLREIAFRNAGGGTGKEVDIDEFDTMEIPYKQLLVWNPEKEEILGGYRYILGEDIQLRPDGIPLLSTSHLFQFSRRFIEQYIPFMVELGRSFVTVEYQSSKAGAKALFALDNLWDGLGSLATRHPYIKYFFGKVTMYPSYDSRARNMLLYFMQKYFPDRDNLLSPTRPLDTKTDLNEMKTLFTASTYKEDYKILTQGVRALGYNIPPLINSYMNLSPSMRMFGTAINDEFGDVEETGILIKIDEIFEGKLSRHFTL